ncbi:MAG: hypothetical protein J5942_05605 [Prevotella sp.]|nr:hypothetical protein [Prevotella sp.]MBP3744888.1 hypothetical protein [Prevotella sp.]MBQ3741608.1 hypothetical protein [Prevotella sp.]
MTTLELSADVFRNMSIIAEDEGLMKRAAKYLRKLAVEKTNDDSLMSEQEFVDRVKQAKKEPAHVMLPGENLTSYLQRRGYDL